MPKEGKNYKGRFACDNCEIVFEHTIRRGCFAEKKIVSDNKYVMAVVNEDSNLHKTVIKCPHCGNSRSLFKLGKKQYEVAKEKGYEHASTSGTVMVSDVKSYVASSYVGESKSDSIAKPSFLDLD